MPIVQASCPGPGGRRRSVTMAAGGQDPRRGEPEAVSPDDIDAYVATFDAQERRRLVAAEAEVDPAILLHRARERRGLSQRAAAELAGLRQQAVSRFERPGANPQLASIRAYLGALAYGLAIRAVDLETGETAAETLVPPAFQTRMPTSASRSGSASSSPSTTSSPTSASGTTSTRTAG